MIMKKIFLLLITLAMMNGLVYSQGKSKESCVTDKCHVSTSSVKFIHGPFAVKDCQTCHQLVPNEKHKFIEIKNSSEICSNCHEPLEMKRVIHGPLQKGNCVACHNPHGSNQQFFLRKGKLSELCLSCHKINPDKKNGHPPVMDGDCTICHQPHTSDNEKLLVQNGNKLCFTCHSDLESEFADAKVIHKPAAEKCLSCHDVHGSDNEFMLAKEIQAQCFTCHDNIKQQVTNAIGKHKAVEEDKKCANCHSPHLSQMPKLLNQEPMSLCLSCHDNKLTSKNPSITNMKNLFEINKNWHGPIREKDCSGCHNPHGGKTDFRLLRWVYPREFYSSFSTEQYELCFKCHQPTLVLEPKTTTLTGFRNGDQNLHFLHVNKKVKGRTCRTCHETHASQKERHIRESVPFGKWELPIYFEKTSDGGKCSPGCHATKEYKRSDITTRQ